MGGLSNTYEYLKIRVDQIADARGVLFTKQLHFIEKSLERLEKGQVLNIFCSDNINKEMIPKWIKDHGHTFLSIIEESSYYKILLRKG